MKRKIRFKSVLANTSIVVLCMTAFSFFIYLFVKDVNKSSVRTDKDEVATISFKYRIAQRKYSDRVVWEPLTNNSPLYDGDTVRTADLSEAKIYFDNNVSVEVGENTMFRIAYSKDGQLRVMVDDGNISVDTTGSEESIELQMDGISVNLESGSRVIARTEGSSAESSEENPSARMATFQMLAGNASVTTENGSVESIAGGESVKIEENGEVSKNPITVTSIPSSHKVLIFEDDDFSSKDNSFVKLEWTVPKEMQDQKILVQTCENRNFASGVETITVRGRSYLLPVSEGITYWRVASEENPEIYAQGKITAELVKSVQANLPKKDEKFFYRSQKPTVNFAWDGSDYVSYYKIELSKNANFEAPFVSEYIKGRFYSTQLEEGSYFWRVTPFYEVNGTGFHNPTEKRFFSVAKRAEYEKPKMLLPPENAKYYYEDETLPFTFSWKSEIVGGTYEIIVAKDRNFKDTIADFSTSKKFYDASLESSDFAEGGETVFCKVIQSYVDDLDAQAGTKKIESEVRSFTVARYVPEKSKLLYPVDGFSVEQDSVAKTSFMWKNVSENKKLACKFQISSSEKFDSIVFEKASSANELSNVKLNQGTYWWRVIDSSGDITDSRRLQVLPHLALANFTYPKNKQKIVMGEGKDFEIKWNKVEGSDYYKVILKNTTKDQTIAEKFVQTPSLSFALSDLSETDFSNFKISVQPFANETTTSALREGDPAELIFDVRKPSALILDAVKDGLTISGLKAVKEDTVFTWHANLDEPFQSEFLLYNTTNRGGEKLIYSEKNAKNQVRIPRLTAGSYKWTVHASTKTGENIDAKTMNEFFITEVPYLAKPIGKTPSEKFVIGPQFLKKNRSIQFEWAKVAGATDYNFVLYQKKSDGSLRKIYSQEKITSNQIRFRNLAALDVGDFVWQVTAFAHAKDGFTEQYSLESENNFKIDFSLPGEVQTVNPGVMYGD